MSCRPYVSPAHAPLLYRTKISAIGVAIDHFSIAGRGPAEKVMPAHTTLLGSGIWIMEEAFLPRVLLARERWYVVALPLRLQGGSGAPARMVAMEVGSDEVRLP